MKKVLNNKFYLEIAAFLGLVYSITAFVHLNGDDFMYGTFAHEGILSSVWGYYHTGNGRLWINFLDSALLFFDRYLYAPTAPLIVLAFIVLLAKNVQFIMAEQSDVKCEQQLVRIGMALFATIDVLCLRETVFWITGMMNYLFPAVVMLYAFYLFQKNRFHPYKCTWYLVVCFLAASSVEQYALMFVGVMTLYHFFDFIEKKAIAKRQWLAFIISLVGLAFLVLAPGNFERVEEQQMPSFASNLWSLVYQNTMHEVALPFMVMLSLLGASLCTNNRLQRATYMIPLLLCIVVSIPALQKAVVFTGLLVILVVQLLFGFLKLNAHTKQRLVILGIVGLGSQIMLLISAIWGFRCMFSMYMVYMLIIMVLLYGKERLVQLDVLACGLLAAFHPLASAIYMVLSSTLGGENWWNKGRKTVVSISVILSMLILIMGYWQNSIVLEENEKCTRSDQAVIALSVLPKEEYSWYSIPMNDFHEYYYKQYHQIEEKEIIYTYSE